MAACGPGKVVGLDDAQLGRLLESRDRPPQPLSKTHEQDSLHSHLLEELLNAIGTHDPRALRHGLSHAQLRRGS